MIIKFSQPSEDMASSKTAGNSRVGRFEPGETPQEALAREIKEELDIEIEVKDFLEDRGV